MDAIPLRLKIIMVGIVTAGTCWLCTPWQAYGHILSTPDVNRLPTIQATRRAGLTGDRSKIPLMIETLRQQKIFQEVFPALHSLAQLGATEGLPAMDALTRRDTIDFETHGFALVSRARLVAEAEARGIVDPVQQANVRVRTFYREIGLTPAQINSGTEAFNRVPMSGAATPLEVFALRELADMLYMGPYAAYVSVPGIAAIQFTLDYPATLKVKLAGLSDEQRVEWLVTDLAHQKVVANDQNCEQQLTADEGLLASRAIGKQLREMDQHRDVYSRAGFAALFEVLRAIGDPEQAWVFPHFAKDANGFIALYAKEVLPDRPFVYGY